VFRIKTIPFFLGLMTLLALQIQIHCRQMTAWRILIRRVMLIQTPAILIHCVILIHRPLRWLQTGWN